MKTKCMSCGGSMKKMAVGGTTTKRIIKKSTGGMYGIPQENLGTSGQYGFAKKGGATKKYQKGGYTVTNTDGSSYSPPANQQGFKKSEKKYGPALSIEDLVKDSKNQDRLNKKRTAAGAAGMFIFKKQNKPVYTTEPKMQKGGATKADPYDVSVLNKKFKIKGLNKSGGKTNMGPTKIVPKKVDPKAPKASKTRTIERNGTFEMKTGGTTKAAKFAALAPPYNKATFADKIVGAKKKK